MANNDTVGNKDIARFSKKQKDNIVSQPLWTVTRCAWSNCRAGLILDFASQWTTLYIGL